MVHGRLIWWKYTVQKQDPQWKWSRTSRNPLFFQRILVLNNISNWLLAYQLSRHIQYVIDSYNIPRPNTNSYITHNNWFIDSSLSLNMDETGFPHGGFCLVLNHSYLFFCLHHHSRLLLYHHRLCTIYKVLQGPHYYQLIKIRLLLKMMWLKHKKVESYKAWKTTN